MLVSHCLIQLTYNDYDVSSSLLSRESVMYKDGSKL